jgi:hypothetical protein
MNTLRYLLLSFLFFIIFVAQSYGQGITVTFSPQPRFFQGFGNVTVGKTKDQIITIKNSATSAGTVTCSITGPATTSYKIIGSTSFSVAPGVTDTLTVRFQPTTLGLFRDTINIDTNAALTNTVRYALSGTGVAPDTNPKISVTTGGFGTFVSFGNVTVGKNTQKTFTIKNVSDTIRTLTGTITPPSTSRYSLISGGGPFSLDTGMSVTVTLEFKPDTVAQFLTDSVFVNSNASSPNNRIKVTLFGTGLKPTPFPRMTIGGVFGGAINFRTDTVGKSPRTATMTITNTSDSARTLTGSVGSVNPPFSILSGGGAFSLDSGKAVTVQLQFQTLAVGTFNDTLRITANTDSTTPPAPIPLVGVGFAITGAHITVQPAFLNFGTVNLGTSPTLATMIKNHGETITDTLTGTVIAPSLPFSITSGGGSFALQQMDSLRISVQCSATKTGSYNDSIIINSNSNDNAKHVIIKLTAIVSGTGGVKVDGPATNFITAVPNPFTGKTAISFLLGEALPVSMRVFDITGKQVYRSIENIYPAGVQQIEWNAHGLTEGTYLCVLNIGNKTQSIRVILSKQ